MSKLTLWHEVNVSKYGLFPFSIDLEGSKALLETLRRGAPRCFLSFLSLSLGKICGWEIDPSALCFLVYDNYLSSMKNCSATALSHLMY